MFANRAPLLTIVVGVGIAAANVLLMLSSCWAMPWDVDMNKQPSFKSNEISRAPAKGSVPVGRLPFSLTVEEAEKALLNPTPPDINSAWRGARVWNAQCRICHGPDGVGNTVVGKQLGAPSLQEEFYRNRTDGRIFAVLHYGGTNMPRYGYKLSPQQHWDVINYLRVLQGRQLPGFTLNESSRTASKEQK